MRTNRAAHYQGGGSDKVYVVSIRRRQGKFEVVARWGRRGGSFQEQVKSTYVSEVGADSAASEVFSTKIVKGYQDIERAGYMGPVTMSSLKSEGWLETEDGKASGTAAKPTPKVTPAPVKETEATILDGLPDGKEFVVVCVNNAGVEDRFDCNVQYVAEVHPAKEMLFVFDKFGKRDEFFSERFLRLSA